MLASLLLLPLAAAAPLGNGLGALSGLTSITSVLTGSAKANAHADIDVFASAFVSSYTGGQYNTCKNLGGFPLTGLLGLNLDLDVNLNLLTSTCTDLNTWVGGKCFAKYGDHGLCTELSAYLTATVYAWNQGWTGADFFACLGVDYVTRWQALLGGLCKYQGCPQDKCKAIGTQWTGFFNAYANIDASVYASLVSTYQGRQHCYHLTDSGRDSELSLNTLESGPSFKPMPTSGPELLASSTETWKLSTHSPRFPASSATVRATSWRDFSYREYPDGLDIASSSLFHSSIVSIYFPYGSLLFPWDIPHDGLGS
ncbi:hypothetical protein BD324DRAFT_639300 [Kockovaella imperatae]|uniref:Uncharacterized protein n=1 Tax=Kockovaella imperatae TaxID=4999 RepID=A0A1Y1U6A0_9TREE|nr:hypothetical protein BD324DRAFT_639300 [Kockovaella imperatae]ORX33561.1 hypothetical protein BD324DRAFT_639300 [Kockovaella imperatae]